MQILKSLNVPHITGLTTVLSGTNVIRDAFAQDFRLLLLQCDSDGTGVIPPNVIISGYPKVIGVDVRNAGDNTELPAKIIRCKNGDVIVDCYNGNITLRGRNITLDANGGGQDGQIILSANRIINAKAPDIRLQGEKILVDATNRVDIISKGFFQLKYGFSLAAAHGDMDFGVLTQTLKKDILATPTTLGDE